MDKRALLFFFCVTSAFFGVNAIYDYFSPKELAVAPAPLAKKEVPAVIPSVKASDETFYVLENDYQQLVFSTKGGSLAEINLRLKEGDGKSLVNKTATDEKSAKFPLKDGKVGGYYPLLRRGVGVPAEYYALSLTPDAEAPFKMRKMDKNSIEFEGKVAGNRVVKRYVMTAPYCLELELEVEGNSELWLSSGVPDAEIVSNAYSPMIRVQTLGKDNVAEVDTLDLPKATTEQAASARWISNSNGFFGIIMDPIEGGAKSYRTMHVDNKVLPTRLDGDYPGYATQLPVKSGKSVFRVFAGPYDQTLLAQNKEANYESAQEIQGWFSFISQPFVKFLEFLMGIFYAITKSWAMSIILLTIALRAMMYPLNNWSIASSVKMQQLAPKLKVIQERYKNDPRKLQMETMNVYRDSGVNPLMGCLPMLLQMPFLMGMFYLLKSSFPLRGASFIPGWINDLSAPDVLFTWGPHIWFIGNELHLLPILTGLTMYLQQKLTMKLPSDASKLTDAQKQQKMMSVMMPLLLTVMFYNLPSGLSIYFMLSTILGVAQQMWVTKKMQASVQP
jgi:YidC/Oxa1 family membrane protein insertase